jgi:hypothetical protein
MSLDRMSAINSVTVTAKCGAKILSAGKKTEHADGHGEPRIDRDVADKESVHYSRPRMNQHPEWASK